MKKGFLKLIFLFFPIVIHAQITIQDNAVFTVSNNAFVFMPEYLDNNGVLENNGILYVLGDITNTNTYNKSGTIQLDGVSQTISFNNDTIENLIVNSAGVLPVTSGFNITGMVSLENGILTPSPSANLVLLPTAQISDGSELSYIDGPLYVKGTGSKYFPVGTQGFFMPVELHDIEGVEPLIKMSAHLFESAPTVGKGTRQVLDTRYWQQELLSGTMDAAFITLPILEVDEEFYYGDSVVVAYSDVLDGPYRSKGGNTEFVSRVPFTYISSVDTATHEFYTLAIFNNTNFNLLYIPNALSQYSSNANERVVKVYGNVFKNEGFTFTVTNQWGTVVYQTNSLEDMETKGWDGVNYKTGKREMIGQYFYYVDAIANDGVWFKTAGSIWIID